MHESRWLALAKQVPVGSSLRVYHGAERRPNMVVRNLPDKWSAYCFHCKEYASKRKDFVMVKEEQAIMNNTKELKAVSLCDDKAQWVAPLHDIVSFLHEKHMSFSLIQPYNPEWDTERNRLVLTLPEGKLGRDIYGLSKAKWFVYNNTVTYGSTCGTNQIIKDKVILTEDIFSAIKAQAYAPEWQAIALLGSNLNKDLLRRIIRTKPHVHVMLDNDDAGIKGASKVVKKLRLHGISVAYSFPTHGDPKDMNKEWFDERLNYLKGTIEG